MQRLLPLIPEGSTEINDIISVARKDDRWVYFMGGFPVYEHEASDHNHFRLILGQLIETGACRPCQLTRAFGIPKNKVLRAAKQLRERGVRSFFERDGGKKKAPSSRR